MPTTDLLAVLSSPRRREILRLVWNDEHRAGEIHRAMPDVSFAAVSQHLRLLGDTGLVTVRPAGRQRLYRADRQALAPVAAGTAVAGIPAGPIAGWRRQQALLRRLPEIWKRLRALEQKMGSENVGDDGDARNDSET